LKEHLSKVPALLVCVSGNAIYKEESGYNHRIKTGDFVHIEADAKHSVDAIEKIFY
jgi:quercetin dioxygenase-like cupin family protein